MDNLTKQPILINGGCAVDERGQLTFVNDLALDTVKRFYMVENFSTDCIRAFHGHLKEEKYFFVIQGSILVLTAPLPENNKPDKDCVLSRFVLTSRKPAVLQIPSGFTHGFRALEDKTKIIIFSTLTLKESESDDYRLPYDYWGKDIWEVKNH